MKIMEPRSLPCGHHRVVLAETEEPQYRVCGTCRRKYRITLVLAAHVAEISGLKRYRPHYEEIDRIPKYDGGPEAA